MSYAAGGSQGLVSTPNFSVVKGQWYRVSLDAAAGADGDPLHALVRRGGGGTNGYEPLTNFYLNVPMSRQWKRYTFVMQAKATVNAKDPQTRDNGARLDFEHIQPGRTLSVANVEIVPISAVDRGTTTALLVNSSSTSASAACPTAVSAPANCSQFVRLSDNQPVGWPYPLPARGSEIVYTIDRALVDSDGDGIADSEDRCAATPPGLAVNAAGCHLTLAQ